MDTALELVWGHQLLESIEERGNDNISIDSLQCAIA